ncbi:hypothetical protein DV736_g5418, partial [Chaetothyriales sp. CBS 134916]
MPPIQTASPVTVSLHELRAGTVPFSTLVAAFGPDSLGILVVSDLPSSFAALRTKVLRNSSRLAALPAARLQSLTNASAKYLVGWSHGVETLKPGVLDKGKGSYYINCAFYTDAALQGASSSSAVEVAAAEATGFEEYTAPNIWPDESDIPGFRENAEQLIRLIIDTAVLVARACDRYGEGEIEAYPSGGYLEHVVKTSTTTKARLLHYFPQETSTPTPTSHSDAFSLTSAMFIDESASSPAGHEDGDNANGQELAASPSASAGLYIRSRTGQTYKVSIPRDGLAFQTGEALELMTRGKFKAVPHFVRGVDARDLADSRIRVARNTLAVFTQPNLDAVVDVTSQTTFGEFARRVVKRNTAG